MLFNGQIQQADKNGKKKILPFPISVMREILTQYNKN